MDFLEQNQLSICHVLLTHWHSDHTGGLPSLLSRYPHLKTAVSKAYPDHGQTSIRDGQIFTTEGATLKAVFTPGHSLDHMCFVLEETSTMFTGDNILGHGNSVVVEKLGKYMQSLQVMKNIIHTKDMKVGYPGHGAVIEDLPSTLTVYMRHWEMREKRVMSTFSNNIAKPRSSLTTQEVTAQLYGAASSAMAEPFIAQVLSKLAEEGNIGFIVMGHEKKWLAL